MSDEAKINPGISRGDFLKAAVATAVGVGAGGVVGNALGVGRIFSNPPDEKPYSDDPSRRIDVGIKHDLREALRAEEIEWVREIIGKHHKPPFRELRDFAPVDGQTHGLAQHVSIHRDPTTGVNYLSWGIRGGGDESDLSKNLNLWCEADLQPDGRISEFRVRIDLKQAFRTGLTPEIDQYIDTSGKEAMIPAKDLKTVINKIYDRPAEDATNLVGRRATYKEYSIRGELGSGGYSEEFDFGKPREEGGRLRETISFGGSSDGVVSMVVKTRFPHGGPPVA